jgi:hypothetical protein
MAQTNSTTKPDMPEPEAKSAPETKKQEATAIGQPLSVSSFDETIMSRNPAHP